MVKASLLVIIALSVSAFAQDGVTAEQSAEPEEVAEHSEEAESDEAEEVAEHSEEVESDEAEEVAEHSEELESEEAELDEEQTEETQPLLKAERMRFARNTITVDIALNALGIGLSQIGNLGESLFDKSWNPSSSGFGVGAQYERRINEKFGVVGRFDYVQFSLNLEQTDPSQIRVNVPGYTTRVTDAYWFEEMSTNIWSVEAQARYYPMNSFYVGGMLGFAGMAIGYEDKVNIAYDVRDWFGRLVESESIVEGAKVKPWRNYIKIGPVVGQRSAFGGPRGGFVWDTYLGYHIAFGMGDKYTNRLIETATREDKFSSDSEITNGLEDIVDALEMLFMSGPRISSSIGWRF